MRSARSRRANDRARSRLRQRAPEHEQRAAPITVGVEVHVVGRLVADDDVITRLSFGAKGSSAAISPDSERSIVAPLPGPCFNETSQAVRIVAVDEHNSRVASVTVAL